MTRKWWIVRLVCLAFLIILSWGFDLVKVGYQLPGIILESSQITVSPLLDQFMWRWQPVGWIIRTVGTDELRALDELVRGLPSILGVGGKRHYVVLFQNSMELRPTGGFMGSYADVWFEQGKLTRLLIQDIYVPDGQIKGYVAEPNPIKKYLFNENHPGWRLRDANWNPDFPLSTKAIDWFFTEGGLPPVDGYMAMDLWPVKGLLTKTGTMTLPDYDGMSISADSFYGETQRQVEEGFFPGSTQKKDFLGSVGKRLMERLTENPHLVFSLLPELRSYVQEKHMSISIPDRLGSSWHELGWDGSLRTFDDDYVMVVEANLGMTKANCCIDRSLTDAITVNQTAITHELSLTYKNNNPPKPQPPDQWGGGYKNYLRVFVPLGASLSKVTINDIVVEPEDIEVEPIDQKQSFGFLVMIEGGQQQVVRVNYSIPRTSTKPYSLLFQKQAGIDGWPVSLTLKNGPLKKTTTFSGFWRTDTGISN